VASLNPIANGSKNIREESQRRLAGIFNKNFSSINFLINGKVVKPFSVHKVEMSS